MACLRPERQKNEASAAAQPPPMQGQAMNPPESSPLGKASACVDQYDATLVFRKGRSVQRAELGISGAAPFFGADLWTAFELSWLNQRGKPQVALAHITVPCETN